MLNSKKKVFFGKYPPGTAPYPPGRAVFGYLQQLSYLILCHTSYFKLHSVNSAVYIAQQCFARPYMHDFLAKPNMSLGLEFGSRV